MILPPDNSLFLPAGNDQLILDVTDRPAPTLDDVIALLPEWAQQIESELRDAVMGMVGDLANFQWARFGQAIARHQSPLFADGQWLDYWGKLLRRPRVANEDGGSYRARLLSVPDRISPNAIQRAVRADVTAVGGTPPAFEEPAADGPFISRVSPQSPWSAWIQPSNGRLWATYPDNVTCRTPGAYIVPAIGTTQCGSAPPTTISGALFYVILAGAGLQSRFVGPIPFPTTADPWIPLVTPQTPAVIPTVAPYDGGFISQVAPDLTKWGHADTAFAAPAGESLGAQVISDVEFRKAAGVSWALIVDPLLPKAA